MSEQMENLVSRTEALVGAFTSAMMATAEAAAERMQLAARVAQINSRMAAFSAILEGVGAQKEALLQRMEGQRGAMRAMLARQVELLTCQETAILEKIGLAPDQAARAVEAVDQKTVYRRVGSRFEAVSGSAQGNGRDE
jgi:hypothetical protein